ncbi:MAG TPA: hypothetical protein VFQ61_10220 [Polyangiaceae bacterium]|nr:hypothetical protein [Polyangiaceae bacterium]
MRWRSLARGAAWCVAGVVGLELLYVVGANAVLHTSLISNAVNAVEGMHFEYSGAYSLYPGRVHVTGYQHRVETYDVEFELTIEHATMNVRLLELASRKFHVDRLQADGVAFRMRHKVHSVGRNGERLKAYPPIEGFKDPPLYQGDRTPATPDADYHSWQVGIRNVSARVRELWILEYRYRGEGVATGSFVLQPERFLILEPATLKLGPGKVTAGPVLAARKASGELKCAVPYLDFRKTKGLEVLHGIVAKADVTWEDGDLGFLNLYTQPSLGVTLSGSSHLKVSWTADKAVVPPRSQVVLDSPDATGRSDRFTVKGPLHATLERPSDAEQLVALVELNGAKVSHASSKRPSPRLERFNARAVLGGVDLAKPIELAEASLRAKANIPSLSWFAAIADPSAARHIEGQGDVSLEFERDERGTGKGEAVLVLDDVVLRSGEDEAKTAGLLSTRFKTQEQPRPFLQGGLSVKLAQVNAPDLLPGIAKLAADALTARELNANVAYHAASTGLTLEMTQASWGALRGRGFFFAGTGRDSAGALLVSAGPARVGVRMRDGQLESSPLVGSDWLDRVWDAQRGMVKD